MLKVYLLSFLASSNDACFVPSQMFKSEFWMQKLILVGGVQISYESMNRLYSQLFHYNYKNKIGCESFKLYLMDANNSLLFHYILKL